MVERIEPNPQPNFSPVELNYNHDVAVAQHMVKSDKRITQRHRLRLLSIPTFHSIYAAPAAALILGQPHVALLLAAGIGTVYGVEKVAALALYISERRQRAKAVKEAKKTGKAPSPLASYVRRMKDSGDNVAKGVIAGTTITAAAELQAKMIASHAIGAHIVTGHAVAGQVAGHVAREAGRHVITHGARHVATHAATHAAGHAVRHTVLGGILGGPFGFALSIVGGFVFAEHREKVRARKNATILSNITVGKEPYRRHGIFK